MFLWEIINIHEQFNSGDLHLLSVENVSIYLIHKKMYSFAQKIYLCSFVQKLLSRDGFDF
jgi:hypothetical protein